MKLFQKRVKCKICRTKKKKAEHEIRINTIDGPHSVYPVCDECAEFFDKSAEVLMGKKDDTV
jgi:hypothetical protein